MDIAIEKGLVEIQDVLHMAVEESVIEATAMARVGRARTGRYIAGTVVVPVGGVVGVLVLVFSEEESFSVFSSQPLPRNITIPTNRITASIPYR